VSEETEEYTGTSLKAHSKELSINQSEANDFLNLLYIKKNIQ
jgi:hypothetical protein